MCTSAVPPPLIFLFACGCSMRSGGKAAISNVTASVEGLDSRTLESYAEPAGKTISQETRQGLKQQGKPTLRPLHPLRTRFP